MLVFLHQVFVKHINSGLDKYFKKKIVTLVFKFIVRNTNNYELQKTTTMHNNTVHTHMIEIITEQKNEMMTITSQ